MPKAVPLKLRVADQFAEVIPFENHAGELQFIGWAAEVEPALHEWFGTVGDHGVLKDSALTVGDDRRCGPLLR